MIRLEIIERSNIKNRGLELILKEKINKSKFQLNIGDCFIASDDDKVYRIKGWEAFMLGDPLIGGILVEEVFLD